MAENGNDTGYKKPPKDKRFSKDNQPSGEAKSKGKKKKRMLKDIAEALIGGEMKDIGIKLAQTFGLDVKEIDLATLADLRQLEKAVKKGDTRAYNAVMDRLRGKPQQSVDLTTDGEKITTDNAHKFTREQVIEYLESKSNED